MPTGLLSVVVARSIRRQLWFILVVGIIAGVVLGTATSAVVGARRTSTAATRLVRASQASDGALRFYGASGEDVARVLRDEPYVEHIEPFASPVGRTAGTKDWFFPLAYFGTQQSDRFVLRAGRLFDPASLDELVVSVGSLAQYPIGSTIDFAPYTAEQFARLSTGQNSNDDPLGPPVRFRVVGAVADLVDMTTIGKVVYATPAYARSITSGEFSTTGGLRLTLTDDPQSPGDMQSFLETNTASLAADGVFVEWQPASDALDDTTDNARVLVAGLLIFAGITVVGGGAALFVILRRWLSLVASNETLSALGADRRLRALLLGAPLAPAAALAVPVLVVVAVTLSSRYPLGATRLIEPNPGTEWHAAWLAGGAVVGLGLLLAVMSAAAWRAAGALRDATHMSAAVGRGRRRTLTRRSIGPHLWLGERSGRTGFVAAAFGVAGLLSLGALNASERGLHDDSRRWGTSWDLLIETSESVQPRVLRELQADPDLVAVALSGSQFAFVNGVPTYVNTLGSLKGTLSPTLLSGRVPRTSHEVMMGPELLHDLGAHLGDEVEISAVTSGDEPGVPTSFRVVGTGIVPTETTERYAGAAYLTQEAFEALVPGFFYETVVVRFDEGVSQSDKVAELDERYPAGVQDESNPTPPTGVSQLHQLASLRDAIAAVFILLSVAVAVTAIAVAARRSRGELVILRCLGHTPRQTRGVVAAMALTFAAGCVVIGAVVGIFVGNTIWRRLTDQLDVVQTAEFPSGWLALGIVVVTAATMAAAFATCERFLRRPPAAALRAE